MLPTSLYWLPGIYILIHQVFCLKDSKSYLIKVPNRMLVGYALDLNEYFRDLLHICILNGYGLQKYKASVK